MKSQFPLISKYVGDRKYKLNTAIRNKNVTPDIDIEIKKLIDELTPLQRNNNAIIYRNDNMSNWAGYFHFYKYFKGKIIHRPEFLNVYQEFKKNVGINIEIHTSANSSCVDLRPYFQEGNPFDNGDKVLMECHGIFLPNTNFKVLDIVELETEFGEKDIMLYMEETNEKSVFEFTRNKMINHECMKDFYD